MILAERAARVEAEAVAARARAVNTSTEALIVHLKLEIEKLRRQLYGNRSERKERLLDQMELQLEELEAAQALGPVHPLPRGRPNLPHEQCRRTGPSRLRLGAQILAVRRLRARRGPRRRRGHAVVTAKLNDVDPLAWLADVLARIAAHPAHRLDEFLPWNWSADARSVAPPQAA
jgi:hypothetical protein